MEDLWINIDENAVGGSEFPNFDPLIKYCVLRLKKDFFSENDNFLSKYFGMKDRSIVGCIRGL